MTHSAERQISAIWVTKQFESRKQSGKAPLGSHLDYVRRKALERFAVLGIPSPREEEWRYTNVTPLSAEHFGVAAPEVTPTEAQIASRLIPNLSDIRLFTVNGRWSSALSILPKAERQGVRIYSLAELMKSSEKNADRAVLERHYAQYAPYENEAFVALNTALAEDGVVIFIDRGAVISEPISITHLSVGDGSSKNFATQPRCLLVAEPNSQSTVVEQYVSLSNESYFSCPVTEIFAADSAMVDYYKVQVESESAYHIGALQVHAEAKAVVRCHTFSFGGRLVRNDANGVLNGEGINYTVNGLTAINETQHVDNHTIIDHAKPRCESHEAYKGVYAEKSTGVFSGAIIVRPHAQKTNAYQSNKSLLLSAEATINSKPQLKIWADDVKCTHGATVGQLDEDALFYLRSRGVGKEDARNMLIHAFASDLIRGVNVAPLRSYLEEALMKKLRGTVQ